MYRRRGNLAAWLAVVAGALILLGLVLPRWLWWLICGLLLLGGGACILVKKC